MDPFVSSEYVAHAVSNIKDLNWHHEPPEPSMGLGAVLQEPGGRGLFRHRRRRPKRPSKGPRPLFVMALETAAKNIQNIDDYWLESITKPEWIQQMWQLLNPERGELSLEAWKKFNTFLPYDPDWAHVLGSFFTHIRVPTAADLAVYTKPLASTASFNFIAHLSISGCCQIKQRDLILLAGLKNLGVLEVTEPLDPAAPFPRVSDRVVKSWSCQEDPFPRLLILKIWSFYAFTDESVRYFSTFPKLALVEVLGQYKYWKGVEIQAKQHGWVSSLANDWWHIRRTGPSCPECNFPCRHAPHEQLSEHLTDSLHVTSPMYRDRWGLFAHSTLESILGTTTDETARDAVPPQAPQGSRQPQPSPPFASLFLGDGLGPADKPWRRKHSGLERIFLWRRSLVPGPRAHAPPNGSGSGPGVAAAWDEEGHDPAAAVASSAGESSASRPSKRARTYGIGDMLDDFQL